MPWTKKDVDGFKKGLSDKQKAKWVATANSVLSDCMKKGGTEKTCAGKAVRIANGTVSGNEDSQYTIYSNTQAGGYVIEEKMYRGKNHLLVPVTMMVEGVHNGSHGPLYHSIAELGKFPEMWNGIPIVINHPEVDGMNISANSPDVIDDQGVGYVFNTHVNGSKLAAEAWLDEERLREISLNVLEAIKNGKPLEVSLGMFTDDEIIEGNWNGENYEAIARNHRPDHLALLPDSVGACSLVDGCGMGVNNKKGGLNVKNENVLNKALKSLKEEGYSAIEITDNTSEGLMERLEALRAKVDGLDVHNAMHWMKEAYDDFIIYESRVNEGDTKLYKQMYQVDKEGNINFTGDPIEVTKKVDYVSVNQVNFVRTKPIKKEVKIMSKTDGCPECAKKVNALIANKESKFTEENREWLESLEEALLDKLTPTVVEIEKKIEVNTLSEEDKKALADYKKQKEEKRKGLIKSIQDNVKDVWTEEVLNEMDDDKLERVFKSVKREGVVDYSGNVPSYNSSSTGEEPLYPTGVKIEEKK
jgi:hypothetical protein